MGCSSSKAAATNTPTLTVVESVVPGTQPPSDCGGGTWATKATPKSYDEPRQCSDDIGSGRPNQHAAHATEIMDLQEADDDFDDPPQQPSGNAAVHKKPAGGTAPQQSSPFLQSSSIGGGRLAQQEANGQEAPTSLAPETPLRTDSLGRVTTDAPLTVTKTPMTFQQQEEAAKLAETRKRFDNQRYHQSNDAAREVVGFSLNTGTSKSLAPTNPSTAFLPGGICDEADYKSSASPNRSTANHNDSARLASTKAATSFDADDEALMLEILEDCDV